MIVFYDAEELSCGNFRRDNQFEPPILMTFLLHTFSDRKGNSEDGGHDLLQK